VGLSKKLASPKLTVEKDTLLGVLRYGPVPVAVASMGFKHYALAHDKILATLSAPNFLLKIIPHVDGTARICELVRYFCEDITIKGAWEGPAALELFHHALAPIAALPVREVISGIHILSDLTLGLGTVVHDYLTTR
jgi:acetoacetate decarboxylase